METAMSTGAYDWGKQNSYHRLCISIIPCGITHVRYIEIEWHVLKELYTVVPLVCSARI